MPGIFPWIAGILLLLAAQVAAADDNPSRPEKGKNLFTSPTLAVGISTWISSGQTDYEVFDPSANKKLSDLTYEKLDSKVVELNAELKLPKGFFIKGNGGFGVLDRGQLTDQDFLSSGDMFSETKHGINDNNLWYVNAKAGKQLFNFLNGKGVLRGFLGYQHWEEEIIAKGIRKDVFFGADITATSSIGQGTKVITDNVRWNSLLLGFDANYRLHERIGLYGDVAYIPYTRLNNNDIHHLRTDLAQNPSFRDEGSGRGVNLELGANLLLVKNMYLYGGYRYWYLEMAKGDATTFAADGTYSVSNDADRNFRTKRLGAVAGLTYQF